MRRQLLPGRQGGLHIKRVTVRAKVKGWSWLGHRPARDCRASRSRRLVAPLDSQWLLSVVGAVRRAVSVVDHALGAGAVAVVDGLGHVPAAVPALVVRAGRRDDEVARLLPDGGVADISHVEHVERHPHRLVPQKLTAVFGNAWSGAAAAAAAFGEETPLETLAVVRMHNHPVLFRALVEVIERVEQAILDMQREKGDGRSAAAGAWAVGRRNVQVGRLNAGSRFADCFRKTSALPVGEGQRTNDKASAENVRHWKSMRSRC